MYTTVPPPATREEIVDAFDSGDAQPLTAGEIATLVHRQRQRAAGTAGAPMMLDRHIKPLLAEMTKDGELVAVMGGNVQEIGHRTTTPRRTTTYYATPAMVAQYKADAERAAALACAGSALAHRIAAHLGDRATDVSGTPQGGVSVTLTSAQARAMFGLGDGPVTDAGHTPDSPERTNGQQQAVPCVRCTAPVHHDPTFGTYVDKDRDPFCPNGDHHTPPPGFAEPTRPEPAPAEPWLARDSAATETP